MTELSTRQNGYGHRCEDPFAKKAELKKVPKLYDFIAYSYLPYIKTYKRSGIRMKA